MVLQPVHSIALPLVRHKVCVGGAGATLCCATIDLFDVAGDEEPTALLFSWSADPLEHPNPEIMILK